MLMHALLKLCPLTATNRLRREIQPAAISACFGAMTSNRPQPTSARGACQDPDDPEAQSSGNRRRGFPGPRNKGIAEGSRDPDRAVLDRREIVVGRLRDLPQRHGDRRFVVPQDREYTPAFYFSVGTTMPRMMRFWQKMNMIRVGTAATRREAKITPWLAKL